MKSAAFRFVGRIPASKSLLNRVLTIESHADQDFLEESSEAKDVFYLREALWGLREFKLQDRSSRSRIVFNCGEGGTTLRFLALRVAREKGHFVLQVSPRLRSRPHGSLLKCLRQLGSKVDWTTEGLEIRSDGYRLMGDGLQIEFDGTTQVASSLLLNSWNLSFDLFFKFNPNGLSVGYWTMTQRLVEHFGMKIQMGSEHEYRVSAKQEVKPIAYEAEPDMSSAFALAALAALNGSAQFLNWPRESLQPDIFFIDVLERMGARIERHANRLSVSADQLKPIVLSMARVPDLFPVLAALCSFAEGESYLFGAPQLKFKESNRLQRTFELLSQAGVRCEIFDEGLKIQGVRDPQFSPPFVFDPDHDHRIAMACGLLIRAGASIKLKSPEVVEKSFPDFWSILGLS